MRIVVLVDIDVDEKIVWGSLKKVVSLGNFKILFKLEI